MPKVRPVRRRTASAKGKEIEYSKGSDFERRHLHSSSPRYPGGDCVPVKQDFPYFSLVRLSGLTATPNFNGKVGVVVPEAIFRTCGIPGYLAVRFKSGEELCVPRVYADLLSTQDQRFTAFVERLKEEYEILLLGAKSKLRGIISKTRFGTPDALITFFAANGGGESGFLSHRNVKETIRAAFRVPPLLVSDSELTALCNELDAYGAQEIAAEELGCFILGDSCASSQFPLSARENSRESYYPRPISSNQPLSSREYRHVHEEMPGFLSMGSSRQGSSGFSRRGSGEASADEQTPVAWKLSGIPQRPVTMPTDPGPLQRRALVRDVGTEFEAKRAGTADAKFRAEVAPLYPQGLSASSCSTDVPSVEADHRIATMETQLASMMSHMEGMFGLMQAMAAKVEKMDSTNSELSQRLEETSQTHLQISSSSKALLQRVDTCQEILARVTGQHILASVTGRTFEPQDAGAALSAFLDAEMAKENEVEQQDFENPLVIPQSSEVCIVHREESHHNFDES
eukprot:TRINITY_DN2513_c0_g1_i3.p1 TRINITY_DN2513_c0_g1~~TRINITY_DN2513_c0_g1_i3.p1  ORF type:complete len:573 (-),score=96.10 TRINITY_DN2513_c0_g1_i3:450-1991(-)